jgi:hypothetical protein
MARYSNHRGERLARKRRPHVTSVRVCLTLTLILFAVCLAALVVPSHGRTLTTFYRQMSADWVCDLRTNTPYRYVPPVTQIYILTDPAKSENGLLEPGYLIPSHSPWDYGTAEGTVTRCYE